ncbi:unnamed protein product [Paramecium octaurelia]|uniref:Uncharacterized protein n=1 Tax=Paramecium octaurelia TaxID=43137 RepID=A0A8S1WI01_PAROT|nr:unnamed protein product [Paramecium octaurelia]
MNQPIQLNCQNPKKGYLIQRGKSKASENPKERQSFAEYVNSLSESQQQLHTHNKSPRKESVPKRHPTLPKLELPSPDILNKRFVVNIGKCPVTNFQSPIYRPSLVNAAAILSNQNQFHNIQSPRHNSFETRKSIVPQQRLLPIHRTSVNNISGRSVRDDDMSLFYYKIGGAETIDQLNEEFHRYSTQHEMISKIDDQERYKQRFKTFLEYIMGKPIFYNLEQLKEKHKDLRLKNRDFNQFKNYLITCFLKVNKAQLDFVFEFSSMIEQYRYCIINSNTPFAIIYNQRTEKLNTKDVPDPILQLAQSTYQKIFQDNSLAPYFIGIEIKQQARKLGKILSQLMAWEQTNDQILVEMRQSHKGMHLTNVHFTLFKQHLVESMRQLKIQEKQIELVTTRMDGYRSYIINQDSLLDYYGEQSSLLQVQQKKYVQLLKRDPRMQDYPATAMERHSQFILRYLTHQHIPTLTKNDLWTIHCKYNIATEWIDSFRDNFFLLIKSLNLNALIIQDYEDIWYKLRNNLTQYHSIESKIGKKKVNLVIAKVQIKLQDNENYTEYFKNANYQMNLHLHRIIAFILTDQHIYNSNDLKVIHQSVKIRESTFNLFVQFLKNAMQEEGISSSLIAQAEEICNYYKKSVCT